MRLYAGFWKRFCANLLDGILCYVAGIIINLFLLLLEFSISSIYYAAFERLGISEAYEFYGGISLVLHLLFLFSFGWLYYAFMESSTCRATLGKMALGIVVVDRRFERVSFLRASGRYWGRIVSLLTLYIGFMMAGFTKKKQALHDKIAGTYVVDKRMLEIAEAYDAAQRNQPLPGNAGPGAITPGG